MIKHKTLQAINADLRNIYDRRALQYAKENKENNKQNNYSYILFKLQNEQFGISLTDCLRVIDHQIIAPVPFTVPYVKGVLHYSGHLIATIDLLQFFGYAETHILPDQSVIIVKDRRAIFCLLVDQVIGLDKYSERELGAPLPEEFAKNKKYIAGIHHGSTAIINTEIIIDELLAAHDEGLINTRRALL